MSDHFKSHLTGLRDPIVGAKSVTPNDNSDLPMTTRAIYIGVAGNLRVTMQTGDVVSFAFGAGWHPIRVSRVWATGTDASAIVACH